MQDFLNWEQWLVRGGGGGGDACQLCFDGGKKKRKEKNINKGQLSLSTTLSSPPQDSDFAKFLHLL